VVARLSSMAPIFDAYDVHYAGSKDGAEVYTGVVDPKWSVGRILYGGYVFGLIIEACTKHQEKHSPMQGDPVQLSSHFLVSPGLVPYEVHIRTLKSGRSYTNIYAEFRQEGKLRVTTLALFGDLTVTPERSLGYHVEIPSPYARRIPLFTHPALIEKPKPGVEILEAVINFGDELQTVIDPAWPSRNAPAVRETFFEHPAGGNASEKMGGGGADEGRWVELTPSARGSDHSILRPSFWPIISDLVYSFPMLLGKPAHWNPTMTWTITFYGKIPPRSKDRSDTTTGLYTRAESMVDPDSRQLLVTEWWTAPSDLAQGKVEEGWRERQVCLASSEQVAIVIPPEAQRKKTQVLPKL